MVEEGIVVDIKDGKIIVNVKRHPACGSCKSCSTRDDKLMNIEFENTIGARIGERVKIELDNSIILKSAFLFYAAPLLGLMLGVFIGKVVAERIDTTIPPEAISALCGITIMLIAFLGARRHNSAHKEGYKPKVLGTTDSISSLGENAIR